MPPNPLSETKTWLTAAQKRKAATAAAALQAEKAKNGPSEGKSKADEVVKFARTLKNRMKSLACFILAVLGLVFEIVDDDKWSIGKDVEQAKQEMVCLISSEVSQFARAVSLRL